VVARAQLLALGMGRGAIQLRLDAGRLHQVHRGVYAVGHRRLTREGRWMAAVLAAGPGAVLSHRSAAALCGLRRTSRSVIEVTAPHRRRLRERIRVRRAPLPADEVTVVDGIPVTTVARTLLDLAAVLPRDQVETAMSEAEGRRLQDSVPLPVLVRRYPGRRGLATVKAIIRERAVRSAITRSELESRFASFLARHGLPRPEVNAPIRVGARWIEVDCLWRRQRLVVELDGRAFHDTEDAYEADRARDRALSVAGLRVVRVTWEQLHREEPAVATDLRTLLRARDAA
jgi:very-short-patch-repair endonuclease